MVAENEFKTGEVVPIEIDLNINNEVISSLLQIVAVFYFLKNKRRTKFSYHAIDPDETEISTQAASQGKTVRKITLAGEILNLVIPIEDTDTLQIEECERVDVFTEITFVDSNIKKAQGTLTLDIQPTDGDTMTVDTKIYTFQATLVDADGNIQIGIDLATTQANLIAAFDLSGTAGTDYAASMTAHPTVDVVAFIIDNMVLTAKTEGAAGNNIVTVETFTAETNVFDAATLGTTKIGKDGDKNKALDEEKCDVFVGEMVGSVTKGWL